MCESQINNMRNTRISYIERASTTGTGIPSDNELRNYLISLEVLGIDEQADITTIRQVFQQMVQEVRTANVGLTGVSEGGGDQELDILMRHQLEVDIKAAFQNIQEFRAKFETDKYLRDQWRRETGEDLDIAIDIEENRGGYRMQQSAIESRIRRGKGKMDEITEDNNESDDEPDDETRQTGKWGY